MTALTVGDVMTRRVICVRPGTGFRRVVTLLRRNGISAVPVVDAGRRPLGVVSEDDVLARERLHHPLLDVDEAAPDDLTRERARKDAATAATLMSAPPETIPASSSVAQAARRMHGRGVRRLVVVDPAGRVAGIVSRGDLLHVYAASDEELRERVLQAVAPRMRWSGAAEVRVGVADGTVSLRGRVPFRSDAMALVALARAADGVVDVRDELSWAEEDITIGDHLPVTEASAAEH